jgi:two-component sensor histidine kinase
MDARARIAVIADIHQRLYSTSQHDRVDFGEYVRALAAETVRSLGGSGRVTLQAKVESGIIVYLTEAVSLALVVNELLTNAVKYAFPQDRRGQIMLGVEQADNNLVVSISDDGIGLPDNFGAGANISLGMTIVKSLVQQVRGSLSIASGPGAQFRIVIPRKDML